MQPETTSSAGLLSRAKELGLMSALGAGSEAGQSLSLEELSTKSSASGSDVQAVMEGLVELKVVEETEPNAYRLRREEDADGRQVDSSADAKPEGNFQPVPGQNAPAAASSTGESETNQENPPKQPAMSRMDAQAQAQAMAYAAQMGYAAAAMYPVYQAAYAHPGTSPPQFYPHMHPASGAAGVAASGQPAQAAQALSEGLQSPGSFSSPVGNASGSYNSSDVRGMAMSPNWVQQVPGGSFPAGVPPPPPPPRGEGGAASTPRSAADPEDSSGDPQQQTPSSKKSPCAFFLKTGTCAYGDKCKFEHPAGRQPPRLNSVGLPMRPDEPDCAFFMKRGACGFGLTCKFNHPEISPARPAGNQHSQPAMQWQQGGLMMPGGAMCLPFPPGAGPAGMMPASGMMSMMQYSAHLAQQQGSVALTASPPGPGGQGAPPPQMMATSPPGSMMYMMAVPGAGMPMQPQQLHGMALEAASKGSDDATAHLHEILGISPTPSFSSSDGLGIVQVHDARLSSSGGSASTHISGDQMHWEPQHSYQQGQHIKGNRRRGGKQRGGGGDRSGGGHHGRDKPPPAPLSATVSSAEAAAAAAAAKESLSPAKKIPAAAAATVAGTDAGGAANGADEAAAPSPSSAGGGYSTAFGSTTELPAAAVSACVTAKS